MAGGGGGGLPRAENGLAQWWGRRADSELDPQSSPAQGSSQKRVLPEQGRDGEAGERGCGFEDQGLEGAQPPTSVAGVRTDCAHSWTSPVTEPAWEELGPSRELAPPWGDTPPQKTCIQVWAEPCTDSFSLWLPVC